MYHGNENHTKKFESQHTIIQSCYENKYFTSHAVNQSYTDLWCKLHLFTYQYEHYKYS